MKKYLILIFVLALVFRLYKINSIPPSLNWDEISHGYNAYSIIKTGQDEWGVKFPLIFQAYGDYKLPGYIYTTSISILIFGLNNFAVRFPSAIAGCFSVIFTYLLVNQFLKSKRIALIASLLMIIEPWSLFLSRGAFEANLALSFFISGLYFFTVGLNKKNWQTVLGVLLLGLTVWTYNTYRIFTPLILFSMIVIYKEKFLKIIKKQRVITFTCLLIGFLFFVTMFAQLLSKSGQARFSWVSILDQGATQKIIDLRNKSDYNPQITRLIYNRPIYFAFNFSKNYISHFSPNFLFIKGGNNYQFNVPDNGILYLLDAPLAILGLYLLLKNKKAKSSQFLFSWLIFAPIASSMTREAPHTLRAISFLPVPMILSAIGIDHAIQNSKDVLSTIIVFSITYFALFAFYFYSYQTIYKTSYSQAWQFGYKESVQFIKENYSKYDKIILTKKYGEPHEFVLFYLKYNPEQYNNDKNLIRFNKSNWFWVDRFDKFYFVNDWNIVNPANDKIFLLESGGEVSCNNLKCLLITSPNNVPSNWHKIKTINFLDSSPAFEIYEN